MSSSSSSEPSAGSKWDNPDPRIAWALKEFDYDGSEPCSLMGYYWPILTGAFFVGLQWPIYNWANRRPVYAGMPASVALMALGIGGGYAWREYRSKKHAEELATLKHYIMTHPDRFPEPERVKFGDKRVWLPWRAARM